MGVHQHYSPSLVVTEELKLIGDANPALLQTIRWYSEWPDGVQILFKPPQWPHGYTAFLGALAYQTKGKHTDRVSAGFQQTVWIKTIDNFIAFFRRALAVLSATVL